MSTFCAAAWAELMINADGTTGLCCVAKERYEADSLDAMLAAPQRHEARRAMLAGERLKACAKCYFQEEKNIKSLRQTFNDLYLPHLDPSRLADPTYNPLVFFDLSLAKTCNQKCRMCGPHNSTAWFKDAAKMGMPNNGIASSLHLIDAIVEKMRKAPFIDLEMKGGEPFYMEENRILLERLAGEGLLPKIRTLHIDTNGSVAAPALIDLLKQVPPQALRISLSIDGTEAVYRYTRGWNGDFAEVEANVRMLRATFPQATFWLNNLVSAMTIFGLPDLRAWADRVLSPEMPLGCSVLYSPAHMSLRMLPFDLKQEARGLVEPLHLHNKAAVMALLDETVDEPERAALQRKFMDYTARLDALRGESLAATITRLALRP